MSIGTHLVGAIARFNSLLEMPLMDKELRRGWTYDKVSILYWRC